MSEDKSMKQLEKALNSGLVTIDNNGNRYRDIIGTLKIRLREQTND